MLQPEMTEEVKAAMDHVREHFPEVTHVLFMTNQRWLYITEDGEMPDFENVVNLCLLQLAADSVPYLPIAYAIG